MRIVKLTIAALVLCLALFGCGVITYTNAGERPPGLAGELATLYDSRSSARLADLTDFTWDTVYLFPEYTTRERVQEVVGVPVIRGSEVSSDGLLVFEHDGAVVETTHLSGDYLRADKPRWSTNVVVEPWGGSGGFLRLSEGTYQRLRRRAPS